MDNVLYDNTDGIATLTLNRPEKRNALNDATLIELHESLEEANLDGSVRVIVLRGAGKDFCAGADISQLEKLAAGGSTEDNLADAMMIGGLFIQMRRTSKPIIAAVQGNALAGGAGIATAADLIIAHKDAKFGYPEVKIGFVPAMVMALLIRIVGEVQAFELAAFGNPITADEAHRIGLVNRVVDGDFDAAVKQYAGDLAARSGSALQLIKRLLYEIDGMNCDDAIKYGAAINILARQTDDYREGVRKFLESPRRK